MQILIFAVSFVLFWAGVQAARGFQDARLRREDCMSKKEVESRLLAQYANSDVTYDQRNTKVNVELWIHTIHSVNTANGRLDMDLYVTETWNDRRLDYEYLKPCSINFSSSGQFQSKIWNPKIRFIDAVSMKVINSPDRNDFVLVYSNGTVFNNYRANVIAKCTGDMTFFPFHNMECRLSIESALYNANEVNLNFASIPVALLSNITLHDYNLQDFRTSKMEVLYPAGLWTELTLHVKFSHLYGWYVKSAFIPSIVLVFISWIAFALGPAVAARAILGLGCLLALAALHFFAQICIPRYNYLNYLDIWMFACVGFVLASLMELALFALLARNFGYYEKYSFSNTDNETTKPLLSNNNHKKCRFNVSAFVDIVFALLFPLAFIAFVVVYCFVIVAFP